MKTLLKPVTQERVLKALNALHGRLHQNKVMQQAQAFALHGLKTITNSITETDAQKLGLELQLLEEPVPSPAEFSARFDQVMGIHWARQDRILEIQTSNNISGLSWQSIGANPNREPLSYPYFHYFLRSIASDLDILKQFKSTVISYWVDYAVAAGLTAYKMGVDDESLEEEWCEMDSPNNVWALSEPFDWANIWAEKYYLSPSLMHSQGFDSQRKEALHPDDRLFNEVHLVLGVGITDYDTTGSQSLWFCASNYCPSH
ncbi:hypothetical protein [Microcoleus sp. MON2_D5]|uniref:hypothetical protein n=1 Tax=Microcoleus sp. MON2_D5 TaxID=2818833 RepID=UPI002FD69971